MKFLDSDNLYVADLEHTFPPMAVARSQQAIRTILRSAIELGKLITCHGDVAVRWDLCPSPQRQPFYEDGSYTGQT